MLGIGKAQQGSSLCVLKEGIRGSHWLKMAKGLSSPAAGSLVAGLGASTLGSGAMFFASGMVMEEPGVTDGSC